ncbi:MAG: zinc ABC transporter substrate-binding protein [Clostridia bacterium]|nr:zinc ABC transporter substrate-binding protein [Clostridia bacterium]
MKKYFAVLLALVSVFTACSCMREENPENGKIKVVATLFPQYDFARQIAGDKAEVSLLLPLGADSHSFDPSIRDLMKIKESDVFIYTGDAMENWASGFISALSEDCEILDVSGAVELLCVDGHSHSHGEEHTDADPHIWTSPENAVLITTHILSAMCNADPENAEYYQKNATAYIGQLTKLDDDIREVVDSSANKKLYFGGKFSFLYFTEHYGLEYMSLYDSCSESAEPGAKRLTEMVNEMTENSIPAILYPELSEPKAARAVSERTGAKPLLFHSCHNLSVDDFSAGKTYISIMYENLENLKEALS